MIRLSVNTGSTSSKYCGIIGEIKENFHTSWKCLALAVVGKVVK